MADKINYRPMEAGEEKDVYKLIVRVFQEYVAPFYSEKGVEKFLGMISPEWLCEKGKGKDSFVVVATQQNRPIGMMAVINVSHIALFFVDSKFQREGIGRHLVDEAARRCIENNPSLKTITVSSSPNSISFYKAIDFQAQGEEVDEDGMRFVPMQKIVQ